MSAPTRRHHKWKLAPGTDPVEERCTFCGLRRRVADANGSTNFYYVDGKWQVRYNSSSHGKPVPPCNPAEVAGEQPR